PWVVKRQQFVQKPEGPTRPREAKLLTISSHTSPNEFSFRQVDMGAVPRSFLSSPQKKKSLRPKTTRSKTSSSCEIGIFEAGPVCPTNLAECLDLLQNCRY